MIILIYIYVHMKGATVLSLFDLSVLLIWWNQK